MGLAATLALLRFETQLKGNGPSSVSLKQELWWSMIKEKSSCCISVLHSNVTFCAFS